MLAGYQTYDYDLFRQGHITALDRSFVCDTRDKNLLIPFVSWRSNSLLESLTIKEMKSKHLKEKCRGTYIPDLTIWFQPLTPHIHLLFGLFFVFVFWLVLNFPRHWPRPHSCLQSCKCSNLNYSPHWVPLDGLEINIFMCLFSSNKFLN